MANNVVVICLDTVRKDFFDKYAPRLHRRAAVSFEQCRSVSSWSVPSHASMFTGTLPSKHGIHAHNRDFSELEPEETFLGDLSDYERLGVSANAYASAEFGLDGLFDQFATITRRTLFPEGLSPMGNSQSQSGNPYVKYLHTALTHPHRFKSIANGVFFKLSQLNERLPVPKLVDDGASLVAREVRRQVADAREPFVQFVNFMDAHGPLHHHRGLDRKFHSARNSWSSASGVATWDINEKDGIQGHEKSLQFVRGLYAAKIDYLDRVVTDLIGDIQRNTERETTIVVTSDHGENLGYRGDDRLFEHTGSLSEGLLHVPLEVINHTEIDATVAPGYVSHLDLGDLVTRLAAGRTPSLVREIVPAEVIGGNHFPGEEPSKFWDRSIRCAYNGDRKVVWDSLGNTEEYRLLETPNTQKRTATNIDVPEWATRQFLEDIGTVKRTAKRNQTEIEVADRTRNRLRQLGYMSP